MTNKVKMRSVLMQAGGQGDGIMAANGMQALFELGVPFLSDEHRCFTRSLVEPLVKIMLPQVNIDTVANSAHSPHPRYHLLSKLSWTTVFRNYLTKDCYFDFAERRRIASYDYPLQNWQRRLQQYLTDRSLSSGTRVLRETPAYYGLKMWAPIAEAWGISEIALLRGLYLSHGTISRRMHSYVKSLPSPGTKTAVNKIAIFPGGGSFQCIPAAFVSSLILQLGLVRSLYTCYFAPGDNLINDYKKAGISSDITRTLDDISFVVANSDVTVTADSFVSHIAQILAKEHVALMSHDLPQQTIHPASTSAVVFEALECCPCYYTIRRENKLCPSGHHCCAVYFSDSYLEKSVDAIRKALL